MRLRFRLIPQNQPEQAPGGREATLGQASARARAAKNSLGPYECFTADTKQGDCDDQSEREPRGNVAAR